jgi:hypothetical protein
VEFAAVIAVICSPYMSKDGNLACAKTPARPRRVLVSPEQLAAK